MSYFSRGRHRAPTRATKNAAAVAVAGVIGTAGATGTAYAGPEGGWQPIISCESGGNPTAQNSSSTASGLFQFINGTWAAYGGLEFAPTAKQATPAEQYIVAERAYAAEGTRPWNPSKGCWEDKVISEPVVKAPAVTAPKASLVLKAPAKVYAAPVGTPAPTVSDYQALPVVTPKGQYTPGGTGEFEVHAGDTLSEIAETFDTDVTVIMDLNPTIIEDRDWIYVGEMLTLK